jgi:hypothetical protein
MFLERWRVRAAGGRHDAVQAQVQRHLAVVVGGVPNHHGGDAQARVRAGVRAFDGIEHVLRVDGAERFADRGKGIAQVNQQLFLGFRRAGAAFVTGVGRFLAVKFSGEGQIAAGDVLHLFGEGTDFGRAELRLFVLEFAFGGAIAVLLLRHGFGGGAYLVFLKSNAAEER